MPPARLGYREHRLLKARGNKCDCPQIIDQGTWEEIGSIDQEAGTVAFGDRAILGSDFVLRTQGRTVISTGAPKRLADSLILECTGGDFPVPVEVLTDVDGSVVAARIPFATDVDEMVGEWRKTGELVVTTGQCVACDPWCHPHPVYRFEFDVRPGRYIAERFVEGHGEVWGLRIQLRGYRGPLRT